METTNIIINAPETSETFTINQDEKKYLLNIKKQEDSITFFIPSLSLLSNHNYIRTLTLKEIKEIHRIFYGLNTCNEFYEFIKALLDKKKLIFKTIDDKLFINFTVDYLFKQNLVEIELFSEKISNEDIVKNLCKEINDLKEEIKIIKDIKEENNNIKKENIELKNQLNNIISYLNLFGLCSMILKINEFDFIKNYIKKSMNKEIKQIKKLYQATIDGGDPSVFHTKCDNIPNTLILIESSGNKRFGGFTSEVWDKSYKYKDDKNVFLFSLDKQKIYPHNNKEDKESIFCQANQGPGFIRGYDIGIIGNPIKKLTDNSYIYTHQYSYNYNEDYNCLSESGHILAKDYEVYQILFD